jgi:hypothetical protein
MNEQQQVWLVSGSTERMCWVDKTVKLGDFITLKNSDEPERQWLVTNLYTGVPPERGWPAGGLSRQG